MVFFHQEEGLHSIVIAPRVPVVHKASIKAHPPLSGLLGRIKERIDNIIVKSPAHSTADYRIELVHFILHVIEAPGNHRANFSVEKINEEIISARERTVPWLIMIMRGNDPGRHEREIIHSVCDLLYEPTFPFC